MDLRDIYPCLQITSLTSDLHQKQRPDDALQEYIQCFTDLAEKAMVIDPANITNHVIIFLFVKKVVKQGH